MYKDARSGPNLGGGFRLFGQLGLLQIQEHHIFEEKKQFFMLIWTFSQ